MPSVMGRFLSSEIYRYCIVVNENNTFTLIDVLRNGFKMLFPDTKAVYPVTEGDSVCDFLHILSLRRLFQIKLWIYLQGMFCLPIAPYAIRP